MRGLRNHDRHSCYVNSWVQVIAGVDRLRQVSIHERLFHHRDHLKRRT